MSSSVSASDATALPHSASNSASARRSPELPQVQKKATRGSFARCLRSQVRTGLDRFQNQIGVPTITSP